MALQLLPYSFASLALREATLGGHLSSSVERPIKGAAPNYNNMSVWEVGVREVFLMSPILTPAGCPTVQLTSTWTLSTWG